MAGFAPKKATQNIHGVSKVNEKRNASTPAGMTGLTAPANAKVNAKVGGKVQSSMTAGAKKASFDQ